MRATKIPGTIASKADNGQPTSLILGAEEKLALLASIVQSSDDAIISKTLDGTITSWNIAAERLFGYKADEMIGKQITLLLPPDRLEEEVTILKKLRKGERVDHFVTQRITKDRTILDISLTISPVLNSKGQVIGASKIARDITQQKRAEKLVQESEERLRMAIESTHLGTWEFYPLSGKLVWSDTCRKIYDVPSHIEVNFDFFSEHIHPEDREYALTEIEKAMDPAGKGNYDLIYRIIRFGDRKFRWIRAKGRVFFNNKDKPERFIGTVLDVTDEKNRELMLQDSMELFEVMANNVPAMIWMSGTDKFRDYFNQTWLDFTGRRLEQEQNDGWLDIVYPDDRPRCIENYNRAFDEQLGFYIEYRIRRHDGEYRWIADNSAPRYNPEGEFVGFISACIDIDDQKRFREKITESELMLQTISNASPVGLWMTDNEAQNTFVNETWINWTGIPFEEQLGTGWLQNLLEEDKAAAPARFTEAMSKKEKFSAEFRLRKADGEIAWCLTEGYPYYDLNGDFAGYAGSVTDITEIKQMERRKDDFIQMASHELKTPITSIKGYVQLLMSVVKEIDNRHFHGAYPILGTSLLTIDKQVTKLTRLVSELLDLTRMESGKLEMYKTHFSPGDMVSELVEEFRQTNPRHHIILYTESNALVYGDRDRLGQVIVNLFTNAIKYSPGAENIEVYVKSDENECVISVRDYGIGIDKKDQEKIFDRFYRVEGKSEQTYPGFGIGLFIASEIIQRHNGSINVESEKGKGSLFKVSIPAT